ncbi:MAG: hypothetical protein K2P17_00805 [Helicobacteraceae bacterium]|nr:hypothetical protein [Helicobacteraceae bacterium]
MQKIILFLLFSIVLNALQPNSKIYTQNFISSIFIYKDILYVSSDNGEVEIYNINSKKKLDSIKLDSISDYFGNKIEPKVFQTHTIDGKKLLILSQDSNGSSKISLYEDRKLVNLDINNADSIIKKAYFIDNDNILLGFLSNEIWLYNLKQNHIVWRVKPSEAVFSDLIINENEAISTTEGGIIYIIDLKNGKISKELEGANFDNVYMLDSKFNVILSAGRDKACGVYYKNSASFKRLETEFLSYAVALSKDSTLGAVSFNENNDILIFNTANLKKIVLLNGGDALPNSIIFIDNSNIVASFDSKSILFWKIN